MILPSLLMRFIFLYNQQSPSRPRMTTHCWCRMNKSRKVLSGFWLWHTTANQAVWLRGENVVHTHKLWWEFNKTNIFIIYWKLPEGFQHPLFAKLLPPHLPINLFIFIESFPCPHQLHCSTVPLSKPLQFSSMIWWFLLVLKIDFSNDFHTCTQSGQGRRLIWKTKFWHHFL